MSYLENDPGNDDEVVYGYEGPDEIDLGDFNETIIGGGGGEGDMLHGHEGLDTNES